VNSWGVRVVALLGVVGSYWLVYQHGRSVERAEATAALAQRDSGDRLAEVLGERVERTKEQQRVDAQEEVRANAQKQRTIAEGAAAGADAAGQRLRDEAGNLAVAVGCPGQDPAVVARSEAARRSAMVLSDLLNRSVETNRELAAAFDRARIAGLACEKSYNVLVKPPG